MEAAAGALAVKAYDDGSKVVGFFQKKNDYVKDLEENYHKLKSELGKLQARRDDIEAEFNRDKRMQATRECQDWILRVKEMEKQVSKLEEKYNSKGKPSWKPTSWTSRSKLSERMAKKSEEVHSLWMDGIFERGVVVAKSVKPVEKIGAPNIEDKQSLQGAFRNTLNYLKRDKITRIGIWGALGIGKTAIMQNLNDNEEVAKMFNIIIWVTVSKHPSIEKLQEAIIRRLELSVEGTSSTTEEKAQRISKELEGKKCLILLDEVCQKIDLHEVMGFRTLQKDSKVVLASRSRGICYDMDADELIKVENLSYDDAWNMFQEIVGDAMSSPSIKRIAELVVNECGGLPLLIDKVARTFKKNEKNDVLWDRGLRRLQRWDSIKVEGIEEVLEFLKLCYHDLDEIKKGCFLYSALYPEECEICVDYLLECWRAEGFMDYINEFKDARGEGHVILKELIDLSLLERTTGRKFVKMNKVLRKMALKMSSQRNDFKLLVKPREGLSDFPKREEWEHATRISLMDNQLQTLPDTLDCCNLLTLLLQRNMFLMTIPESFFASMQSLRVLDLHATAIEYLPSSLSNSIHLRGLYLNSCIHLREFQFNIKSLVNLEALDIRGTQIGLLQIGSLERVRCLQMSLSNLGMDNHIEWTISNFNSLEELSIEVCSSKLWWDKIIDSVKKEVAAWEKLTSLRFCFPEVDFLELFVSTSPVWKKNSCMTFQFANDHPDSTCPQILESFCYLSNYSLKLVDGNGVNPRMLKQLMVTYAFGLINHRGVSRLSDFGVENMNRMLVCLIEGCNEMETIINGEGITQGVLKCLEHLFINNELNLKSIWQGPVYAGSLAQLKNLTLSRCPELKKIFSNGMIQQLPQLQHLRVEECGQIEEIIMESENIGLEANALPSLKTLVLLNLPELTSIWIDDSLEWPSLQRIKVSTCDKLKRLPFNNANATKLRFIEGHESWWGELVWKDEAIKQRLQSLCIFN